MSQNHGRDAPAINSMKTLSLFEVPFYLSAALARLGRLVEARSEARAGLAINPAFTIYRFRADWLSDNPTAAAGQERIIDGLRKAGVPEE
jgi:hypothetical protein